MSKLKPKPKHARRTMPPEQEQPMSLEDKLRNYAPPPQFYALPPAPTATYRIAAANAMVHNDAAVAEVVYQLHTDNGVVLEVRGKGVSKREREDSADRTTGEALAMARAFEEAAARLHRIARSRTRAQDSERRQRALRRTREEWEALQADIAAEAADQAAEDRIVEAEAGFTHGFPNAVLAQVTEAEATKVRQDLANAMRTRTGRSAAKRARFEELYGRKRRTFSTMTLSGGGTITEQGDGKLVIHKPGQLPVVIAEL